MHWKWPKSTLKKKVWIRIWFWVTPPLPSPRWSKTILLHFLNFWTLSFFLYLEKGCKLWTTLLLLLLRPLSSPVRLSTAPPAIQPCCYIHIVIIHVRKMLTRQYKVIMINLWLCLQTQISSSMSGQSHSSEVSLGCEEESCNYQTPSVSRTFYSSLVSLLQVRWPGILTAWWCLH